MKLNTTTKLISITLLSTLLFACNSGSSNGSQTAPNSSKTKAHNDGDTGYSIVIDCGSSGSRVYLYQYDATDPTKNISIVQKYAEKISVPLASYANNPDGAVNDAIKPLLTSVISQLKTISPNTQLKDVELFIGGTAGMRLVPAEQQNAIWTKVKQEITAEGFTNSNAITIDGQDEGLYTWMDYNFVQGNKFSSSSTNGTIEVGGASAQVAFATPSTGEHIRTYEILGKSYNVYSVSFLGFGVNQARAKLDGLSTAATCYPSGYVSSTSPIFNGNFNFDNCNNNYSGIISAYTGDVLPSSIKNVSGFSSTQFAGLGNVWDTVKLSSYSPAQQALKKAQRIKNNPIENTTLRNVIKEECARGLSDISNDFGDDAADAPEFCANAVFSENFVFNTLSIQDGKIQGYNNLTNPTINPNSADANEIKINWTLGYLLNEHFAIAK